MKTRRINRNLHLAARMGSLAALLLAAGCVVPVPSVSRQLEYGREITAAQVRFIVPGRTSRAEVVAQLGGDFRESRDRSALAYSWQYPAGKIFWCWGVSWYVKSGVKDVSGWHAYFVAFDKNDRVIKAGFHRLNHLGADRSLDEQLDEWTLGAARTGPAAGVKFN